ncbi:glycosyltransferase [bacterium]|nr:glycosyltransferase [bacterium]
MNDIVIGIVVPVYKVKKEYLDACLYSILNQTYSNIRVALVDDCSPDECGKYCDEYAKKDDRVFAFHHEKNKGLPEARNTGIKALLNIVDWMMFVDSDDWIELDCCSKLVNYLKKWAKKPDLILYTGFKNYVNSEIKSEKIFDNETWFEGKEQIQKLQEKSFKYTWKECPQNTLNLDSACWRLVSVNLFKNKGIYFIDVPYKEDGLFFLHSTENCERIVYIYETFYHYRSTSGSMVNSYREKADAEHKLYLSYVWEFMDKYNKDDSFRKLAYYPVLLSMEICVTQKFFNKNNPNRFSKKQKECKKYFLETPYKDVFKTIKISNLRRNHRIKAILIKYRLYAFMQLMLSFYNKRQKKEGF